MFLNHHWLLAPALSLLLAGPLLGQQAPTIVARGVGQKNESGSSGSTDRAFLNRFEIVSDTPGVDLCPYLTEGFKAVRKNWLQRIPEEARPPEMKRGEVTIEFELLKDGRVKDMRFVGPSGNASLAQAAWDGVKISSPFPALPPQFPDPDVTLRVTFRYNPVKTDTGEGSHKSGPEEMACAVRDAGREEVFEVTQGASPPTPIYAPLPAYPKGARTRVEQGAVTVGIVVESDGSVREAVIVKGLNTELDKAALEAVRSWKFEPARKAGKPVAAHIYVEVNFKLY